MMHPTLHRFFLTDCVIAVNQPIDLEPIAHQLQVVLRLQAGAQVILLDGVGQAFLAELTAVSRKGATGQVLSQLPSPPEPAAHVTLYQSSLKADKFEWVLQKGTELGIACFVPVISSRSIVRPEAALLKKYERWGAILREAAEQCGRGRIPTLAEPLTWRATILQAQGCRLLPWEAQQASSVTVKTALTHANLDHSAPRVNLLIGPEGGLAPEEVLDAQRAGWQTISLGPRILRAETAALTSIVLVMEHLGQLPAVVESSVADSSLPA